MITNYFKIAWRNLKRHKAFAFTNIFGLSLGIACSILVFTVVTYHLSFDSFHSNAERTYRVVSEFQYDATEYQPGVPQPLGKAFRNDFSFAEKSARVRTYHDVTVYVPGGDEVKKFREEDMVAFAEPDFFSIFNFPVLEGDVKTILTEPNAALLTQKMARKYFDSEDVIGKVIRINSFNTIVDFKISGLLKDIPANTDRKQQIYLSYPSLKNFNARYASDSSWGSTNGGMNFFVLLKPGITKAAVEKAMPTLVNKYYDEEDAKVTQFKLQPLNDIHFNPRFNGYVDKKYLWALGMIAAFLIIAACVNFINLATAKALNRSKEVGVRKVLGGLRSQLFWQFMAETIIITLFALVLAYGIAQLVLPAVNALFKEELSINLFQHWQLPVFLLLLLSLVVFLSGSYPGLVLARLQPVLALKGKLSQKSIGGFSLRRSLVVIQFAISQMLIIGMFIVARQMHYSKTADLGFKKEAMVMLPVPMNDKTKMNTLRTRLSTVAGVEKTTFCYMPPASDANSFTSVRYDNHAKDEPWEINLKDADDQYVSAFGLKLAAGRNLFPSDTVREVLVNETVVKKLGFTSAQEVIGKTLFVNGGTIQAPIVGVVKDFNNLSFREAISPVVIMTNPGRYRYCAVKINLANTHTALEAFKKIWSETYPENVYSFNFLDEQVAEFYRLDTVMLKLVESFALVAILIACLGLYGLVSFMAVQKTKEIGIRKVLGASVQSIVWLFGKEFTRLLLIAFVIAAPVAWFVMQRWLQEFAYRLPMGVGVFLLVIGLTFIVAAITVGYSSIKSALTNPVKSLKSE